MANINGTNISAPIVPFTDSDIYATHEAKYGKGGYRTVENFSDLALIPEARLEEGMFVYVINDPNGVHNYQYLKASVYTLVATGTVWDSNVTYYELSNGSYVVTSDKSFNSSKDYYTRSESSSYSWERSRTTGIPILSTTQAAQMGYTSSDDYIGIPDSSNDLNGSTEGNEISLSENGDYLSIIFRAIREMQAKITKLTNAFDYGIESYPGTTTTISSVSEDYSEEDIASTEPIWTIDESALSELLTFNVGAGHKLYPGGSVSVRTVDSTQDSYLKMTSDASWWIANYEKGNSNKIDDSYIDTDSQTTLDESGDTKLFLYFTLNTMKMSVNIGGGSDDTIIDDTKDNIIDFSKFTPSTIPTGGIYNVLLVISRKRKFMDETTGTSTYLGNNFVWFSVGDPSSDETLVEGYWLNGTLYNTAVELSFIPTIKKINFTTGTSLYKLKVYSKYQDFTNEVVPSKPSDTTYKYKAAHLTIRAVDTQSDLVSIKDQILNGELIWVIDTSKLWIKSNYNLYAISGGTNENDDDDMTNDQLKSMLTSMGYTYSLDSAGEVVYSSVKLNNIKDITFINSNTSKKYKYEINEDGEFKGTLIPDTSNTFAGIISNKSYSLVNDVRGFVSQIRLAQNGSTDRNNDAGLYGDRIRIASFYAPLSTDKAHGCSHSYIELENTADVDFPLTGCYLYYTRPDSNGIQSVYSLELTGTIYAGSTYLIRGKKHSEYTNPNTYIKVTECDQEFYDGNGNLISFEIDTSKSGFGYGFALTYGNSFTSDVDGNTVSSLSYNTRLFRASTTNDTIAANNTLGALSITSSNITSFPYIIHSNLIDSIYYYEMVKDSSSIGYWCPIAASITSNTLYRNTFELDPAKQAFNGFTTKDSSRARWASAANDIQIVDLSREYIEFPHTSEKLAISTYTPKYSLYGKNVITGKSTLDQDKPNMATVSFGIDIYKTRCFNWVSKGYFDEYVWIKESTSSTWKKFNSYIPIQQIKVTSSSVTSTVSGSTTTYTTTVNFIVTTGGWSIGDNLLQYPVITDLTHTKIGTLASYTLSGSTYTTTFTGTSDLTGTYSADSIFYLHQSNDDTYTSGTYPMKKFFSGDATNSAYSRITNIFPGDGSQYTSHKCIVDITSGVSAYTEYDYCVGRADKNGNPDADHTVQLKFSVYPYSTPTRLYQITDQQGFHWIEYQVWAAVADSINTRINSDNSSHSFVPILVNTGDMTQNGTRINEWLDYYSAGINLFNHIEQMNMVGNNDLCNTDVTALGTGDDTGKSNSYFFHLFYCYEMDPTIETLCPNLVNPNIAPKYIPSLYYIDTVDHRIIMINSEITEVNCKDWFGLYDSTTTKIINIYNGYLIGGDYKGGFTSIYTMLWRMMNGAKNKNLKILTACHEMPFTVITEDSTLSGQENIARSFSNKSALIGSHCNQISTSDTGKGIYWLSRLLEYFGCKLMIGGHKHTYMCTWPIRENYTYTNSEGSTVNSKTAGPMPMPEVLNSDSASWKLAGSTEPGVASTIETIDSTKFPYLIRGNETSTAVVRSDGGFYPCHFEQYTAYSSTTSTGGFIYNPSLTGGVTYFMCQASGYKLTSNKELPTQNQKFSRIIPKTTRSGSTDSPDKAQKYPMFAIVTLDSSDAYTVKLVRVDGIMVSGKFSQTVYSNSSVVFGYLKENTTNSFGTWGTSEVNLISI